MSPSRSGLLRALLVVGCALGQLGSLACFPKAAGRRLAHFAHEAPAVGQPAPATSWLDTSGQSVELAALLDGRPVVLWMGSHSCPVYRYRRHSLGDLWQKYAGQVRFVLVYTREAHPVDAPSPHGDGEIWDPWLNRLTRVRVTEPADLAARLAQARHSHTVLELPIELYIDPPGDPVWTRWGRASTPAFVLDGSGRVVLRQPWIEPRELDRVLDELLKAP